jgi:site-specific recombinase XerD
VIDFLHREEIDALFAAPDLSSWHGRRDRTLLLTMIQTGLRVSEAISLKVCDVELGTGAHVRCFGKGRKKRATPLRQDSRDAIGQWLAETCTEPENSLFTTQTKGSLSRDAVERLVQKHTSKAAQKCPSLHTKRVTPHVLRHTAAMQLLQSGVDRTVIALWLGHESVETTQMYLHADIAIKERAMAKTQSAEKPVDRYRPPDDLLGFLENL